MPIYLAFISVLSHQQRNLEPNSLSAHNFKIIYQLIDHIKADIRKLKGPEMVEKQLGKARVKAVFRSSKFGQIAGCGVLDGIIKRGAMIRIIRDEKVFSMVNFPHLSVKKKRLLRQGKEPNGLGFKISQMQKFSDDLRSLEEKVIDE